ncbi:MAG: response regulator [Oligoflexales bacterium]
MAQKLLNFLIVEDDDDHAELLISTIEDLGIAESVERLDNGEDAVNYLTGNRPSSGLLKPDIVLMDLKLPKLSGIEVLKAVRCDNNLAAIPIIMLSTSPSQRDIRDAYLHHANAYLVKPMEFDDLSTMVTDLVNFWSKWNTTPKLLDDRSPKGGTDG